jgi:hypothetical protein
MTENAMTPLLPAATRTTYRGWPERRRPHKRPEAATSKTDNLQALQDAMCSRSTTAEPCDRFSIGID